MITGIGIDSRELISSVYIYIDRTVGDMRLKYYLLSQETEAGTIDSVKEPEFGYAYGVMIEEFYQDRVYTSDIKDLCPVRKDVVDFIDTLHRNQVTATSLHDVAQDWVLSRI
jgi:hypothetical protein